MARKPKTKKPKTRGESSATGPVDPDLVRQIADALGPMLRHEMGFRLPGALAPQPMDEASLGIKVQAPPEPDAAQVAALKRMPFEIATSMDPRLQLTIANARSGKPGLALASSTADEHPVIARVADVAAWEAMVDVVPGATLGRVNGQGWVVTGRIPIRRLEAVRADANVLSLKSAQLVTPQLAKTVEAMEAGPAALTAAGVEPKGGQGVIVGIVDFGGDFAHRNFVHGNGKTRILALWDQAGVARVDSPFGYGRLHKADAIDAALATNTPYATLGYGPAPDSPQRIGAHGTHVMDIAAGNGGGTGQPGVAPEADIVFVEASITDTGGVGPGAVNRFFGDSVQLLEAVRFIFDTAGDMPCVVNLSLGTNGGPHDGTSLVEMGLDALVSEKLNRAVVIAASNSHGDDIHTSGQVPAQGTTDLRWRQTNSGGGEIEVWYPGERRLTATLLAEDGTELGRVKPGENLPLGSQGQIAIFLSNRLNDPNNHDNVVSVFVAPGLTDGDWTLRLTSADGEAVDYHAWIERADGTQAAFVDPVLSHTLGSISTGHETVVVGSYDAHKADFPISPFSSAGPTRDGREKPEVAAPGGNVFAAHSRTGDGVTRKSGTSMAAPAVTGLIALILAEARRNGQDLDSGTLRQRLVAGVLGDPPVAAGADWDPRFGRGRASARSIQSAGF